MYPERTNDVRFETTDFMRAHDGTRVLLTRSGAEPGMRPESGAERSFVWTLESWQAESFAEDVADLVEPGCRSGSGGAARSRSRSRSADTPRISSPPKHHDARTSRRTHLGPPKLLLKPLFP
jgi:hypothetical protein